MTEPGMQRYFHADIADLSGEVLRVEVNRLRQRLALEVDPAPWFRERLTALEAERARRRRGEH